MSKFSIANGRGFSLNLPNGWTVSVQFGAGSYGNNREADFWEGRQSEFVEATLAEIACFPSEGDGEWYNFSEETAEGYQGKTDVKGWVTVSEFAEWLEVFKNLPPVGDHNDLGNLGLTNG